MSNYFVLLLPVFMLSHLAFGAPRTASDTYECTFDRDDAATKLGEIIYKDHSQNHNIKMPVEYISANFDETSTGSGQYVLSAPSFPDRAFIKVFCKVSDGSPSGEKVSVKGAFDTSLIKRCDLVTGGEDFCLEGFSPASDPSMVLTDNLQHFATFVVRNLKGNSSVTFNSKNLKIKIVDMLSVSELVTLGKDAFDDISVDGTDKDFVIDFVPINPRCKIIVSGLSEVVPEAANIVCPNEVCSFTDVPAVYPQGPDLLFKVVLEGMPSWQSRPKGEKWTGGPGNDVANLGKWSVAPAKMNVDSEIMATVTMVNEKMVSCGLKVNPRSSPYLLGLGKGGDCMNYGLLREYYLYNDENNAPRVGPYPEPLTFVGMSDTKYGTIKPEIPVKGVMNGAYDLIDQIIPIGANGEIPTLAVERTEFKYPIVLAYIYYPDGIEIDGAMKKFNPKKPNYYGVIRNYNDYTQIEMTPIDLEGIDDNTMLVFVAYLAHRLLDVDKNELRGTAAYPDYPIIWNDPRDSQKPFDRAVPFTGESCVEVFNTGLPIIMKSGGLEVQKQMPTKLAGSNFCNVSRPFKKPDLDLSKIKLDILHIVAETALDQYPTNLLVRPPKTEDCSGTGAMKNCWVIKKDDMPPTLQKPPHASHDKCKTTSPIDYGYGDQGSVTTYEASCKVLEVKNECTANMAFRFSGYQMMMNAALGCVAKYHDDNDPLKDLSGMAVTATLRNQGIVPYKEDNFFGGSVPKNYTDYDASKFYSTGNKGYDCIPCRFASDATKDSIDLDADTLVLPVDQDANAARKPIFTFTRSQAPESCITRTDFEVRYFGSGACNGVDAGNPSHMCTSANIGPTSCPVTGNNVAGKFTVDLCPGSDYGVSSVSSSWSPLILDLTGQGINISRTPEEAVIFDIRGDGVKRQIDWPINVQDVAFLVLPNKKGEVKTARELFGQYKAKNGFEALKKLDSNKDGIIDGKDKKFSQLKLWFDYDRNGKSSGEEIQSLVDHGVDSIVLKYHRPLSAQGAQAKQVTSIYFNRQKKAYLNVIDIFFYEYWDKEVKK